MPLYEEEDWSTHQECVSDYDHPRQCEHCGDMLEDDGPFAEDGPLCTMCTGELQRNLEGNQIMHDVFATIDEAIKWVRDHTDNVIYETGSVRGQRTTQYIRVDGQGEIWILNSELEPIGPPEGFKIRWFWYKMSKVL